MLLAYVMLNLENINIYAIGFALAGATAFWFETIRVWIKRPIA
jgi:hypothetical protein